MQELPAGKFHGVPFGDTESYAIRVPQEGAVISAFEVCFWALSRHLAH
jgi:hypothetical protein